MTCAQTAPAPFRCPTFEESLAATAALLPQGRMWPARDLGRVERYLNWLTGLVTTPKRDAWPAGFVQCGFVAALASVRNFIESRICDLRLEFFCATRKETDPEWMKEYGLPDACDPFPDLCAKVAALGGSRCEYYADIAARAGWSLTCLDVHDGCGDMAGLADAGDAQTGDGIPFNTLQVVVDLGSSPAYVASDEAAPFAGALEAGFSLACDPGISPLQCILDRIVHAEIEIVYTTQ